MFGLFLVAVGVRASCCMAVEYRLAALCFARSSRATHASLATNLPKRGGGIGLSRKPPKLRSWRCTQPRAAKARAAKAAASVAAVGKMASITRAAAVV